MKASAAGRAILRDRPVVRTDTVDMDALARLPAATFGRAYYEYMTSNGCACPRHSPPRRFAHPPLLRTRSFSPDERDVPRDEEDPELAFVLRRYRETHDFTHTLVGLPPTVLGELAVKWFELVQTGLPITALSAFVGPLRLHPRASPHRRAAPLEAAHPAAQGTRPAY